jgi:hypothetical protein
VQIAAAGSLVNRMVALLLPAAAARAAPVQDALDPAAILVRAKHSETSPTRCSRRAAGSRIRPC